MEMRSDWLRKVHYGQQSKFMLNPFQFSFVADNLIELIRGSINRQRCTSRDGRPQFFLGDLGCVRFEGRILKAEFLRLYLWQPIDGIKRRRFRVS